MNDNNTTIPGSIKRELARMDDQKYTKIDNAVGWVIYRAISNKEIRPGQKCPTMWGGNSTYGDWHETYWGSEEAPILYQRTHKTTREQEFYILSGLVYKDD